MKNKKKVKSASKNKKIWLFGKHACFAALNNPNRECFSVYATEKYINTLKAIIPDNFINIVKTDYITKLIGDNFIHQGIAVEVSLLKNLDIAEIAKTSKTIIILDQVTDPHNVGAILRSAAAFDVGGIVVAKDNAPEESGTMAKSASGALEIVPMIKVTNLNRAIDQLKKEGYWCIGLDGSSSQNLHNVASFDKTLLILGSEGSGLRSLVKKNCDIVAKLPISPQIESLNVSNAAALALYEISLKR